MSLLDEYMTKCTMLVKTSSPDGEGGASETWADGQVFYAAIVSNGNAEKRAGDKQVSVPIYTVTVPKGMDIKFHDAFRRNADGNIYRVTSVNQEKHTPNRATFHVAQFEAEEWRLP